MTNSSDSQFETSEFEDVDESGASSTYIDYLDVAKEIAGVATAKEMSVALMNIRPGDEVLDLGCGTGDISIRLGRVVGGNGRVVGVDYSESMVEVAQQRLNAESRAVSFEQGDIHELRFGDDEFDACRAERVFMHLENPTQALREMVRVTRPGGRLVVTDPDIESLAIDLSSSEFLQKISSILPTYVRHSRMGRSLRRRFAEAHLQQVKVDVVPMVFHDYETANTIAALDQLYERLVESKLATADEVTAIKAELVDSDDRGTFAMYGNLYVASGTVEV
jgi:ubiquinone/menaquinone biosynthesis C-methylase UbiE